MMAAGSSKFPARFIALVFLFLLVSAAFSSAQGNNRTQPCVDGTYEHGGRTCCLCGAGLQVEEHCTTSLNGKCKVCDPGTYSSYPNNQESCERCTSCSQPNANLEVDEPCTPARDTKCRCKKDHYCSSGTETCQICYSCKVCKEGVEEACTAKSDTVCKEKTEGVNLGIAVGVPVAIVLLSGLALALILKKRRDRMRQQTPAQANGSAADVELQPLRVPDALDIQPHLPDIAEAIGWKDMKVVAMCSKIPHPIIEACQQNHPHDSQEQTIELLMKFVERNGKKAPNNLVQFLEKSGKRDKAERVTSILSGTTPA